MAARQDTIRGTTGAGATTGSTGTTTDTAHTAADSPSFTGQSGANTNAANDATSQLAAQLAEVLRANPGAFKDILSQAGQSTGQVAGQAAGQVQEQAASRIETQKANVVAGLGSVVEQVRQMGQNLRESDQGGVVQYAAQYGDAAADRIEKLSTYLNERDMGEIVGEVENFARRNATYFVGGAFLLGVLGARFLKSSSPRQALMRLPQGEAGSHTHTVYSRTEGSTEGEATTSDGATHPLATPIGELP